jgi:hypothetical protein
VAPLAGCALFPELPFLPVRLDRKLIGDVPAKRNRINEHYLLNKTNLGAASKLEDTGLSAHYSGNPAFSMRKICLCQASVMAYWLDDMK